MKKIFALALVAVFCLAGYGVSAQTQSKNQKLSPKQEKREAREQRRAQRQAEYERYIDSLVTSGNFQFIPNSMRVMPAGSSLPVHRPKWHAVRRVIRAGFYRNWDFRQGFCNFMMQNLFAL